MLALVTPAACHLRLLFLVFSQPHPLKLVLLTSCLSPNISDLQHQSHILRQPHESIDDTTNPTVTKQLTWRSFASPFHSLSPLHARGGPIRYAPHTSQATEEARQVTQMPCLDTFAVVVLAGLSTMRRQKLEKAPIRTRLSSVKMGSSTPTDSMGRRPSTRAKAKDNCDQKR